MVSRCAVDTHMHSASPYDDTHLMQPDTYLHTGKNGCRPYFETKIIILIKCNNNNAN